MKPFLLVMSLLGGVSLFAQAPATPPTTDATAAALKLFRAKLPGGLYEVAVHAIVAVTSHEYVVDGIARVTEVNVDTNGSLLARFYYLEPQQPNSPRPMQGCESSVNAVFRPWRVRNECSQEMPTASRSGGLLSLWWDSPQRRSRISAEYLGGSPGAFGWHVDRD